MFKWPGKISLSINETTLANSIDIVPTVLAACNLDKDENLPGINIMNKEAMSQRKAIFTEAYEHDIQRLEEPTLSLTHRIGPNYPWKLILPDSTNLPEGKVELSNISQDPAEKENLINVYPSEAQKLSRLFDEWWIPKHLLK